MARIFTSLIIILATSAGWDAFSRDDPYQDWPLSKAVEILNSSFWARHETFTRVVSGVGSGISGEKEIYNTFYVRFLSARPIREAYARVYQIGAGYDSMTVEEQKSLDESFLSLVELDVRSWVVVAVGFRSNDPNEESSVRRFFQSQTTQTLRNRAFLSTERVPQVELAAYFQPRDESVGAKFVFPRHVSGKPLLEAGDKRITFELQEVPGAQPRLRATFAVKGMSIDGRLVY